MPKDKTFEICLQSVNQWLTATQTQSLPKHEKAIKEIKRSLSKVYEVGDTRIFQEMVLALEKLVLKCNMEAKNLDSTASIEDAALLAELMKLQAQSLYFLKNIFDIKTNKDLAIKLSENREFLRKNKENIIVQNFNQSAGGDALKDLESSYRNREFGTKYLNNIQREPYRVILCDGRFKKIKINGSRSLKGDNRKLYLDPFSTGKIFSYFSSFEPGFATITVDKDGNMFAGQTIIGLIHHSSYVSGGPVFFAGLIATDSNGELKVLTNESGHYRPSIQNTVNFLKHLGKRGALSNCLRVELVACRITRERLEDTVDIDKIQKEVRKETHAASSLTSYQDWRTKSNAGFFARRYQILHVIDAGLLHYFKTYNISSPKENIEIIDTVLSNIQIQREKHPNSKRAGAINELEAELINDKTYWTQIDQDLEAKAIDYDNLQIINS